MNIILVMLLTFAPQKMRVSTTPASAVFTWTASTPGVGCAAPASITYNIYQGLTPGGESTTPINPTPITGLTYTTTNVVPGTSYYWTMIASEQCSTTSIPGAISNEVSATIPTIVPPSPPTNLAVVSGSVTTAPNALALSWTCSPSALQGPVYQGQVYYNVYRNGVVVNPSPIYCNELLCHYYDNNGLVSGSTYTYLATAWTPAGGESGASNSVSQAIP
jgi:hypothetical protein